MSHNYLNLKELTFKDDELNEYIQDMLKEYKEDGSLDDEDFVDDIHYYLFNQDYYIIGTNTVREAREILIERGGIDIEGEPHFTDHAYTLDAVLFEKSEVQR